MPFRFGILSTHPIQYYSPWYRALKQTGEVDLTVYYAHRQTAEGQATAGFGVPFQWDIPLLDGYRSQFLENVAQSPSVFDYRGCDTPEIGSLIASEHFDAFLVHGWYNRSYWQAMRACWRTRTPLLVRGDSNLKTPRSLLRRCLKQLVYRRFIPRFDAYLVVGRRARDYYAAYGADPRRMFFSPHFVDNAFFSDAADRARTRRTELRQRWGLKPDATVFLFAGKFIPLKRLFDFIEAVAQAAQANPSIEGLLVGDGPLRSEIETAIQRLKAPIRLCGFLNQSAISEAYAAADALVLCSEGETWGLVVNEAMAAGLPAVVTDRVGCGDDLIRDGETGYVYPCGAVSTLRAILLRCATDPPALGRMGQTARELVSQYSVARAAEGALEAIRFCQTGARAALRARGCSLPSLS